MSETTPGLPVWYELMSDAPDAAERFYGAVAGWRFSRPPGGLHIDYRVAAATEGMVAGVMRRPEDMPMRPGWLIYFGTDDPDAAASRAEGAGGRVHMPGTDIPGVGRFAFLSDPQGLPFYAMRMAGEASGAFREAEQARPGHAVWNELSTPDPLAAVRFYGTVLGLRQEGSMPMGPLGDYGFLQAGAAGIGAVMGEMPNGRLGWQVYFAVDDIDAAAARLGESGGRLLRGPDPIPGGQFSLVAEDTEGARFGLVGPRRA